MLDIRERVDLHYEGCSGWTSESRLMTCDMGKQRLSRQWQGRHEGGIAVTPEETR
jgi:hypothetical protein